ncbi:hypothetical protein PV328_010082 [Microctonus aethiopoides]|nr:hypothetical protein PV328_010082 [Microctonus aethiopoides]
MKVHQDSSEPITLHQTKASRKEIKQTKTIKNEDDGEKSKEIKIENTEQTAVSNINGKSAVVEFIQHESQQSSLVDCAEEIKNEGAIIENVDNNETKNKTDEIENGQNDLNGHKENKTLEEKSNEITETLETSETITLTECEKVEREHEENDKEKKEENLLILPITEDNERVQNRDCQSGSDLVGSTTSESSPVKDVDNYSNKKDSNTLAQENEDVSLISYDSNIMLKDVQIKLNDCLKDNSKLLDVTDPNASMSETFKDLSFGRTLRGISGRNSLRRMKHVTVRERLLTPNDSLFVNTSGVSLLHDQSRYSDMNSPYQSSSHRDRKRKFNDDYNESTKKIKTDESYGLINTSLEYLRNLRKPIQVSTPKAPGYKFNIDDKKTNDNEHVIGMEQMDEPKKWCVIM